MNDPVILAAMISGIMGYVLLLSLASYVFIAITMMFTAKRLKVKNGWLAFIPIANMVLLANMAKMHWWPVLLLLAFWIPMINMIAMLTLVVFTFIWMWKVCERRHRPGWWALLVLIPIFGWIWYHVMWGLLAWSKK